MRLMRSEPCWKDTLNSFHFHDQWHVDTLSIHFCKLFFLADEQIIVLQPTWTKTNQQYHSTKVCHSFLIWPELKFFFMFQCWKCNMIMFKKIKSRYQWMVKSSCRSPCVDFDLTGSTFVGKYKSQILSSWNMENIMHLKSGCPAQGSLANPKQLFSILIFEIDLFDGDFFRAMEWLMFFSGAPSA